MDYEFSLLLPPHNDWWVNDLMIHEYEVDDLFFTCNAEALSLFKGLGNSGPEKTM